MKLGFDTPYEPHMTEQFPAWLSAVSSAYDALSWQYSPVDIRFLAASDNANRQLVRMPFDGRRSLLIQASQSPTDLFKAPAYNYYELLRLLGDKRGTLIEASEQYFPKTDLFHTVTVLLIPISDCFSRFIPTPRHTSRPRGTSSIR